MTGVSVELELTVQEVLDEKPACEGKTHPMGLWGHKVESPAAYFVFADCGHSWLCCEGWLNAVMEVTKGSFLCSHGGATHGSHVVSYTSIE